MSEQLSFLVVARVNFRNRGQITEILLLQAAGFVLTHQLTGNMLLRFQSIDTGGSLCEANTFDQHLSCVVNLAILKKSNRFKRVLTEGSWLMTSGERVTFSLAMWSVLHSR
jgi:hypothetical protein